MSDQVETGRGVGPRSTRTGGEMAESMIERLKIALRPFLHHGIDAIPDVETEATRAVLAAMREPTEVMIRAGKCSLVDQAGDGPLVIMTVNAVDTWENMIDASLAEELEKRQIDF